jgi:hypothetical protein
MVHSKPGEPPHDGLTLLVNNLDLHISMLVVVKLSDRNTILRTLHQASRW